jgi:hypothetical protein
MAGATPKTIIADNAWHLAEWSLDTAGDWGAVAGIGGAGANALTGSHTIDSVYVQNVSGASGTTQLTFLFDFVAKSDGTASIATLVPPPPSPEPVTLGMLACVPLLLMRRR